MMYADDTVLYVPGKSVNDIMEKLNSDFSKLDKWFAENELIMNLSKGKTEALLFGKSKTVAKESANFRVNVNDMEIQKASSYKYLGVQIDSTLNMNTYFDKCYKNASSRLNLLAKLREQLDVKAAKAIYESMILPTFTYCGILLLYNTRTQSEKLASFYSRAEAIINRQHEARLSLQSVTNANKKRACIVVRDCLDNNIIEPFKNYFQLIEHSIGTRNRSNLIRLPRFKTKYARRSFSLTGAKEFNMLPLEAREMTTSDFKSFLKTHFC